MTEKYAEMINQQKTEWIVESATEPPTGKEFYIPHKPVMRTQAESTKLRVVYDASARENSQEPSLNDCLYAGPPLQNRSWNVLVRMRFHPVAVTGDIKNRLFNNSVSRKQRDTHSDSNKQSLVEILTFTRELFGLVCSPFLLGGVVERHLESWEEREPELVAEICRSLYVYDLLSGKPTVEMKLNVTKRELLSNLASIYDPLDLVAPVTLKGKTVYRETCKEKTAGGCITSKTTSSRIWSMGKGTA